ncbi:MAG: hypothetical protein K2G04_04470, partial [Oscillospiraceae bacterium]|nr:hypothetical protein [Oscillospiraceae bacterium]
MNAKFESTETTDKIYIISILTMVFGAFILSFQGVMFALIPLPIFFIVVGLCMACRGEIIADEEKITVVTTFLGKAVRKKIIEYADVDRTDCGVEVYGTRYRNIIYTMRLTIKMKGVSRLVVSSNMNIAGSFPA